MKKYVSAFALGLVPMALIAASPPSAQPTVSAPSLRMPADASGVVPAATAPVAAVPGPAAPTAVQAVTAPVPAAPSAELTEKSPIASNAAVAQPRHRSKPSLATPAEVRPAPPLVPEISGLNRPQLNANGQAFTAQEQASLAVARRWRESSNSALTSVAGPDGTVRFVFGASQPSIVCAVLQVCDVELQRGETVNSVHYGDTARWLVEPAVTGSGATETIHLVIKPLDADLETTLMVTTNRRTYHMRLRSHRSEFIPRVAFVYPEEAAAKWDAISKREAVEKRDSTIPSTGESIGDLSFDYRVDGSVSWKPVRVYNDGRKTFIQMPSSIAQTEAPSLLLVRKDGGIFSDEETAMVNYRVQNDRFIVDAVFEKAILIAGVGSSQDRVTITRGK